MLFCTLTSALLVRLALTDRSSESSYVSILTQHFPIICIWCIFLLSTVLFITITNGLIFVVDPLSVLVVQIVILSWYFPLCFWRSLKLLCSPWSCLLCYVYGVICLFLFYFFWAFRLLGSLFCPLHLLTDILFLLFSSVNHSATTFTMLSLLSGNSCFSSLKLSDSIDFIFNSIYFYVTYNCLFNHRQVIL